jgi:hypothetical protein
MKNLQKMGGIAALYEAVAYVIGMMVFLAVLDYPSVVDPAQKVALLAGNQTIMYTLTLLTYVVFGAFLVVLALALHHRLKAGTPALSQAATAFGLIWAGLLIASGMVFNAGMGAVVNLAGQDPAQAATVWVAIEAVSLGLGGVVEIVGGIWILLVSWAALRAGELSRILNYLGIAIGAAGILSAVPALGELGTMVFGLGQIVWFVWVGIVLLRSNTMVAA